MSSVQRELSQVPSRYLWTDDGAYVYTYAQFQASFTPYNPEYLTPTVILFANDTDLGHAVRDLENAANNADRYTNGHISLLDLGKKVYLGVQGGNSELFTFNLIKVTQGNFNDGNSYYVITATDPLSVATTDALEGYGEVNAGRA